MKKSVIGTKRGLQNWGEDTMTFAKRDFVPVEFGNLRGSGTVEQKMEADGPIIELAFGGETQAGKYALVVHERPARHDVGTDKYLEKPAFQRSNQLIGEIGKAVRSATGMK